MTALLNGNSRVVTPASDTTDEGFDLDGSFTKINHQPTKVFHDIVHPHMELAYLCYQIINTPQFQRLRNLKQLGCVNFVYPSASHSRFEHCIGTCFLAGKYARVLQKNQPELDIDDCDILCIEVAGLCHDLGHGPLSHLWESFVNTVGGMTDRDRYSHEEMSIRMFDFMLEDNNLMASFRASGLCDRDVIFIKEAIFGKPLDGKTLKGRDAHKYFLYQIVSNEETKVDVDKFDYLLRDSKLLNVPTAFVYGRVFDNSRVIEVEDEGEMRSKLAYRQKIVDNLEDLFRGRFRLHQNAYQHKIIKISEQMMVDAWLAADAHFRVYAQNGTVYKLSTAHKDPSAFMTLSDSIMEVIMYRREGGPEAATLLKRILCRDLYKYLGYFVENPDVEHWGRFVQQYPNLVLVHVDINYGKGSKHPLAKAWFYEKMNPDRGFRLKFDAPSMQSKFHIVLKTGIGFEKALVDLDAVKKAVKEFADRSNLELYFE